MYRRPRFLELLLNIREEMAREADYDIDFFVEMVRSRMAPATDFRHALGKAETERTLPARSKKAARTTSKKER